MGYPNPWVTLALTRDASCNASCVCCWGKAQQSSRAGRTGEAMSKSRAAGDSAGDVARRDAVEPRRPLVGFPFFEPVTTIYSCRRERS